MSLTEINRFLAADLVERVSRHRGFRVTDKRVIGLRCAYCGAMPVPCFPEIAIAERLY